jgi:Zn-dependent peptidase ImmA (M78 family)/transcriptional regulator with XRE-family HTH domain
VQWAVREDGRPPLELAEKLKVDEDTLLAWASGTAKPTVGQVTRLADLLKRPRALFFLPAPPEEAGLPISYRHPPGADGDVSQNARLQVRRARRVQDAVSWALRDEEPVLLPQYSLDEDAAAVGELMREWTGVTVQEQSSWGGGEYPAYNGWRAALDAKRILVFSIEIGRGDVRGFSSWDDRAPLITVNVSSVSPSARVFTIGHELGHLVTRTDAACLEPQGLVVDVDVERWCEQFAAALLMPASAVHALATARRLGQEEARVEDVRAVMNYFHVSARAAALRLIDLGYARPRLYVEIEAIFRPREPAQRDEMKRPPKHVQRESQYGARALREILTGLPEIVALRVLRITVDDARKIAERVPGIDVGI